MIRLATMGDLLSIQRIAEQAFSPFVALIGKKPAPMVADFARQIDDEIVSVFTSKAEIVGYCVSYPKGEVWHVENLAIGPVAQGQGIGAQLMADAERQAQNADCAVVDLYTNVAMAGAIAFYPCLGYKEMEHAEEDGFQRVYFRKILP